MLLFNLYVSSYLNLSFLFLVSNLIFDFFFNLCSDGGTGGVFDGGTGGVFDGGTGGVFVDKRGSGFRSWIRNLESRSLDPLIRKLWMQRSLF